VSENKSVVLNAAGKNVELPVYSGTLGAPCVDITRLPKETGLFTYDPGFVATASCRSAVTYIDGDEGVLLYRGYPSRAAGQALQLPRDQLPADERRAARTRPSSPSSSTKSPTTR